jgi:hypothetical protein
MPSSLSSSLRASVLFLGGLCLAAGLSVYRDGAGRLAWQANNTPADLAGGPSLAVKAPQALNDADWAAARTAWAYIRNNTRAETGLVDSVAGFSSATLWDQGSYIMALVAARRLDIISSDEFEARAAKVLETLGAMPLVNDRLPNKAYDTRTLAMVDYDNQSIDEGLGWSALDVARLLLALRVMGEEAPHLRVPMRSAIQRWDIAGLAATGEIVGAARVDGELALKQEGRIGYEQYAARSLVLWGLDVSAAMSVNRILDWETVEGVEVATDLRRADDFGVIDPVLSEPYLLQGLELGFNRETALLAERVYQAQERRFASTGVWTMVSEDHLDRDPRFLYSTVYGDGEAWAVLADDGTPYPDLRTVSAKAVFGWDVIFGTEYTSRLRQDLAGSLADPNAGWLAGRFESDGSPNAVLTLNTNAIILEAMHFKAFGPMLSM